MSEFSQRFESAIQSRRLLSRGQKILVAVSGGADSMALLHLLHAPAASHRWKICVAHFNHQLRGRASAADEAFVRRESEKLRLPFFSGRGDVAGFARQSKISIEMAARKLRHEFLARVARRQKIASIALAHHADDQVELFFLRLLRGAGGEALAGMKWRSPSPADKNVTLVRPLLGCNKSELLAFAGENKIRFRGDTSNGSIDFLRNKIRNELLPLLRKNYQPAVDKTVLRLMDIVGAESEFVGATAQAWLYDSRSSRGGEAQAGLRSFNRLPVAVQRRVVQQQLMEQGIPGDFELIEQLRQSPGTFVSVGSRVSAARDAAGKVVIRSHSTETFNADELRLPLQGRAGRAEFGGQVFSWALNPFNGSRGRSPRLVEQFDAAKIGGEIILRHWRAGDRFQPIGRKSASKLQDLFVNAKIPAARRRELVLAATASGEIFWVEGLRIGEKFKLTSQTRNMLAWKGGG